MSVLHWNISPSEFKWLCSAQQVPGTFPWWLHSNSEFISSPWICSRHLRTKNDLFDMVHILPIDVLAPKSLASPAQRTTRLGSSALDRLLEASNASPSWAERFLKQANGKPRYWWYDEILDCWDVLAPAGDMGLESAEGVDSFCPPSQAEQGYLLPARTRFLR